MKVNQKVIILTGAGGGIGGALVTELLERGASVVAIDLRQESLDALKRKTDNENLSIHALNVSDREAVEALPAQVIAEHGRVDGLINCAGIVQPFVKVNDLDYEDVERVIDVNFYGTLYMTKAFLPTLLERPEAHLVNVSSMGGFLPVPGQSVYGASKAAVKLLSEGLYAELLETSVRVTVAFPGATETEITKNSGVEVPKVNSKQAKKFPTLPADEAARQIIDAMESDKPQVYTGRDSKLMNRFYRLSPVRATRLIARQMKSLLR